MPNPTKPEKQDNNRNGDGTFKKGQSGNPNGRPKKGFAIADILDSIGDTNYSGDKTMKEAILEKVGATEILLTKLTSPIFCQLSKFSHPLCGLKYPI